MLKVGSKAPDFKLKAEDGKSYSLKDFKSKYIVLYFYPKDLTAGCTMQARTYTVNMAKFKKLDATVIGVSTDDSESHKKFRSVCKLNFLLLSDPKRKTIKKYDSYGNKGIFGFGTIRNTFVITEGKIAKIFKKVNPREDPKQVIDFINSSLL
jgi:thioredoxin-dependent peroxiredoxin